MANAFVGFDTQSRRPQGAVGFYESLLGWTPAEGPPGMTMFAGERGPWGGVSEAKEASAGWLPYVEVEDVDATTERATALGATLIQPRTKGPAGSYTVVEDPGGARVALWQKG